MAKTDRTSKQEIDRTVIKETVYIASFVVIFSMLMEAVFLVIHHWDYTVLLGNILGIVAAVLNFFLMGLMVQKAVLLEPEAAQKKVKLSQTLRMFMLLMFAVVACVFKCFNIIPFAITLLFPRIAIAFRPYFEKKNNNK